MEKDSTYHTLVTSPYFTDEQTEPQRGGVTIPGSLRVSVTAKMGTQARTCARDLSVPPCAHPPSSGGLAGLEIFSSPNTVFPGGPGNPGMDAGLLGAWAGIPYPVPLRDIILSEPQFSPL